MTTIEISKLAAPVYSGDWHDKPLVWGVFGPGAELQQFRTKADAVHYASARRRSGTMNEAIRLFLQPRVTRGGKVVY